MVITSTVRGDLLCGDDLLPIILSAPAHSTRPPGCASRDKCTTGKTKSSLVPHLVGSAMLARLVHIVC